MKKKNSVLIFLICLFSGVLFIPYSQAQSGNLKNKTGYTALLHGGAGSYSPELMTEERIALYESSMTKILRLAENMLKSGSTAVEVVEACIMLMEYDTLYNAGRGAVFTADGKHTLDASIMDGETREAGAVAGLMTTRNPIRAARLVMDSTEHVLISGKEADKYAASKGLHQVENTYFDTGEGKASWLEDLKNSKNGTVGAVVQDIYGNIAAGTSTGGMSMKRYGRIGDSPVIGAGTYADNETCAISCTGHGEYFIRYAIAHDLHARMKYKGDNLLTAAADLKEFMDEKMINGGFIAIDAQGNIAKIFNTRGMLTGQIDESGISIKIYENELIQKKK